MINVITKKEAGVFLVYYGFLLLLLPMVIPPSLSSLTLLTEPKSFGFEDDLISVGKVSGSPVVVTGLAATGKKAVECQNWDYVRWDLEKPTKTLDLSFNVSWAKLPILNESFAFCDIFGIADSVWQDILVTSLHSDSTGYRVWNIWTGIPEDRGGFVSSEVVYSLETNRWYNIRMTADLENGAYKIYMNGSLLASITDVMVPEDVYIDFFRLGITPRGETFFTNYYDDITVSLLGAHGQKELTQEYYWLHVQVLGIGLVVVGGYLWWLHHNDWQKDKKIHKTEETKS